MDESNFYRKTLENGVTVLFEKRSLGVVAVATSVKYGAQYESESEKGISHFIEHLVFKGTKNRSVEQIPKEIEDKGGIINAFTSEEVTCFWNKLPRAHFHLGADLSRDLVLNPLFEKTALERERKVILEEIKMYHDNPTSYVFEKIKELLYEKPFNMSIAGTIPSVSRLSREQIVVLHNSMYTTNNMVFSVVGNTDFEQVVAEAKKFPKSVCSLRPPVIVPSYKTFSEKRKGIDQAHTVFGFHMPTLHHKLRYASEIFDSILGGGMSSRLFQELREKRGLCYSVKSNLEQSRAYAHELIYAGTVKEKVRIVKDIILREIKKIHTLSHAELAEAQERLIGLREISKEKCDSTMIDLLQEELGGNAKQYYHYEENINKIRLRDVRQLSKLAGYSFVSLVPY